MAHKRILITGHVLKRFRERWPESRSISDRAICDLIRKQVVDAKKRKDVVVTPGGVLYPISYLGRDGYVILKDSKATTVVEKSWNPEANEIRKERGYG